MTKRKLRAVDRAPFRAARTRGAARLQHSSALIEVRYDLAAEAVILTFQDGASMTLPRRLIPGLEREPTSVLETVVLSLAKDALLWPSVDAHVYLPGLVELAFGRRLFTVMARGDGRLASAARTRG